MKRFLARSLPIAVSVVLLALLWRQLPAGSLGDLSRQIAPRWVGVGLVLYVTVNLVRALRSRVLLPGRAPGLGMLLPVSLGVSLLGNTLPIRAGEVSFVVLARTHAGVPAADAAAAVTVARLLDLVAVAVWFVPLALWRLPYLPPTTDWPVHGTPTIAWMGGAAAVVLGGALTVLTLVSLGRHGTRAVAMVLARTGADRWRPARRALRLAEDTVDALGALRRPGVLLPAFGLTLVAWLGTFTWLYAFARALGGRAGFAPFVVGATFASLSKAIPTPTLGGHGVSEAGWTLGMSLVGWPPDLAIATGLGVSVLNLVAAAALGLPALAWLERARRQASARPETAP